MVGRPAADDKGSTGHKSGDKKKKEKKGFKIDRYENYQRVRSKKQNGGDARKDSKSVGRVKAVVFDETARREYLLGLHKRKNERRVKAFVDAKQKLRRENAKVRRAQREEARQSYNRYAKVPILPNFTYQLPTEEEADDSSDEKEALQRTVHILPASMSGEHPSATAPRSDGAPRLDDDFVTVEVRPLFDQRSGAASAGTANGSSDDTCNDRRGRRGGVVPLPANDFSDLPRAVEEELRRLKQETKGPARTKPRVHMLRELQKIQKIKKHSRKGHGKKTAKGKKRNR